MMCAGIIFKENIKDFVLLYVIRCLFHNAVNVPISNRQIIKNADDKVLETLFKILWHNGSKP